LLEGSVVNVPPQGGRKHPEQKMIQINTENILFIAGGAFDGVEKIIASRMRANVIGYSKNKDQVEIDKNNLMQYIAPPDLKKYGLIPEIVGRLPVVTFLSPLDKIALKRILLEPKNALVKQFSRLFEMDNIKLTFADEALDMIVDKAIEFKLGARGLRSIIEAILNDAMFELPSKKSVKELDITVEYVNEKLIKNPVTRLKVA
jgi:ATP-dependent Clp protease ATP-binding subunit ClpX